MTRLTCEPLRADNPRLPTRGHGPRPRRPEASGGSDKRANTSSAMVRSPSPAGARLDSHDRAQGWGRPIVSVDGGAAKTVDLSARRSRISRTSGPPGRCARHAQSPDLVGRGQRLGPISPLTRSTCSARYRPQARSRRPISNGLSRRLATSPTGRGPSMGSSTPRPAWRDHRLPEVGGLTRDGNINAAVWNRLQTARRPTPTRAAPPNPWIEVNKSKQVLLYCKNGAVV